MSKKCAECGFDLPHHKFECAWHDKECPCMEDARKTLREREELQDD